LQVLVLGAATVDVEHVPLTGGFQRLGAEVEHDEAHALLEELGGDAAADSAIAADDVVVAQLLDRAPPPPLGKRAREDAPRDPLDENGRDVGKDSQPGQHEHDRDQASPVVARHRVEPGKRDRDDRPVGRLHPRLVQRLVEGDRSAHQDGQKGCHGVRHPARAERLDHNV
jgi:hypothetical protein